MKRWTLLLSLACLVVTAATAQARWLNRYGDGLRAARTAHKPLLVVLEKPAAQAKVTPASQVVDGEQETLLADYVLCKVDASTDYGQKVAEAFNATEFPFTAIIDNQGKKVLYRRTGEINRDEWVSTLRKYRRGRQVTVVVEPYCPSCQ